MKSYLLQIPAETSDNAAVHRHHQCSMPPSAQGFTDAVLAYTVGAECFGVVFEDELLLHLFFLHLLLVLEHELCCKLVDVVGFGQAILADAAQELLVGVYDAGLLERFN